MWARWTYTTGSWVTGREASQFTTQQVVGRQQVAMKLLQLQLALVLGISSTAGGKKQSSCVRKTEKIMAMVLINSDWIYHTRIVWVTRLSNKFPSSGQSFERSSLISFHFPQLIVRISRAIGYWRGSVFKHGKKCVFGARKKATGTFAQRFQL